MKTYIRKSIRGYYIDFPEEIDAQYWAGKIGSTYDDFKGDKWILLSDEQVEFHNQHANATIEQVITMTLPEPHQKTIEEAKAEKIEEINDYDASSIVNGFDIIRDNEVVATSWLTPAERSNYRSSIDAAELVGLTELSLYVGELPITLSVQDAKLMLAQIQLYADQCFIITKQHIAAVEALDSMEAVNSYNVTTGYPERLRFTI